MKLSLTKIICAFLIVIAFSLGFITAFKFPPNSLLDDYNKLASGNFNTAIQIFRDQYKNKRIIYFGKVDKTISFKLGEYNFVIIPGLATTDNGVGDGFNIGISNSAAHINSLVIMLACKWKIDGNVNGDKLLYKLIEIDPGFKLSSPGISNTTLNKLPERLDHIKSEADQWDWRMGNNENDIPAGPSQSAQQIDAPEPASPAR